MNTMTRTDEQVINLPQVLAELTHQGFARMDGFIPTEMLAELRERVPRVLEQVRETVGSERLARAGERGVIRCPMLFDPYFLKVLELPHLLSLVDATVGPTAILHLQNAFATPPRPEAEANAFQEKWHPDIYRVVNKAVMSINVFIALDDFDTVSGATQVVPGTHQSETAPSTEYLNSHYVDVEGPAGMAFAFDSTLWHRGGWNQSDHPRMAMNLQFTKSYMRQQMDYPRVLPASLLDSLPERTRQLLGMYVRVPASLDEYYVPADQRLYRANQG
jgi:ectoine hydroxylase-related dioxygenase (phytanoyl-CoA dioxygenase family)